MSIEAKLQEFSRVAADPNGQLNAFKAEGKKVVGVLPYYAPEELVYAAGLVPMGIWGSNNKTISRAKEYCATFYCTIAQLALEMLLDGTMDKLDGIITPTICDTLRPMSQNFRVAMGDKLPVIFLAHPQNRFDSYGLQFCVDQYTNVKKELEKIAGKEISTEDLKNAIKVYNASRAERRRFVKLAGEHPEAVSAVNRSAVLKASWFMLKDAYTAQLKELNDELEALPASNWKGVKIITSGIICDNPKLLQIIDDNHMAIVADDVAHESRSYDVLLYDPQSAQNRRGEFVASLAKNSGAQGLVLFMQQFCDPEEMEYPYLKKALDAAHIPHIKLGVDQQMRDFGQAATALEAFADML